MTTLAAADRYTGFHGGALGLLVAAGFVALAFGVVFAIRYWASFPKQPDPGPETNDLGPEPPALVNLLVNRFEIRRDAVPATLVDLAARRVLGLEQIAPGRFVVRVRRSGAEAALTPYEQQVLETVRAEATGGSAPVEAIDLGTTAEAAAWWKRFAKAVVADARARGLARNRWTRSDWLLLGTLAGVTVLLLAAACAGANVGSGGDDPIDGSDWFVFSVFAWGLVMAGLASLRALRDTPEGRGAAARWLGVREHQHSNPSFAEASPASVAIWGRHLAYGVALGTARAASAALPLAAEDPHLAWSRAGGSWRQVRVEYPTRFGYGEKPVTVLAGGLVRLLFWGAISFVLLPAVIRALWSLVTDLVPETGSGAELLLGAGFVVVFGVMGGVLVVRLVDGAIRTYRAAADLGAPLIVGGTVVKVGHGEQAGYLAVDRGTGAEIRAWRVGPGLPSVRRGGEVRVTVTRHLGYVVAIDAARPDAGGVGSA